MNRSGKIVMTIGFLASLCSCGHTLKGRITFDLDGGVFSDSSFSTTYLEGESGTPIKIDIPDPVKDGYYFVGWREKRADGKYVVPNKKTASDGKSYYYYPYVDDVFYAYFEPLVTMSFDLTDGKDDGATLVEPVLSSTSLIDDKLNGYASKRIPSTSYLPTAMSESGHLEFDYWYLEYPLKTETDSTGTVHYSLDTSGEKGKYRFDQAFGSDFMSFLSDDDVTLYASWSHDATITVHYAIDGIEDSLFQDKDDVYNNLINEVNTKIGINLFLDADSYYYRENGYDMRFAGFYLDNEYKTPFYLDSPISDLDFDIYLKWENKVDVTLDFNGGIVEDETTVDLPGPYYVNDILENDILELYTPRKDGCTFVQYENDGVKYVFGKDAIPNTGKFILTAKYDVDPVLKLTIDYPAGYVSENPTVYFQSFKAGDDIGSYLEAMRETALTDELTFSGYYYTDDGLSFNESNMPDGDIDISMKLDYKSTVSISTVIEKSGSYSIEESISNYSVSYGNESAGITLSDFAGIEDSVEIDGNEYLIDGIYYDVDCLKEVVFPIFEEPSHSLRKELELYRKMTKAVTLTFYSIDNVRLGSLNVLPTKLLSDYEDELKKLLGDYVSLFIKDDGGNQNALQSKLPSSDTDVFVRYA